jgi:hypothetical protein
VLVVLPLQLARLHERAVQINIVWHDERPDQRDSLSNVGSRHSGRHKPGRDLGHWDARLFEHDLFLVGLGGRAGKRAGW